MSDPQVVQPRGPCVQVTAASNPELKVIKPDPELVERARAASMAHQAEFQAAARLDEETCWTWPSGRT
jgi:hypothetical protein